MSDVPAGWFPDPSGAPGLLRYWDGTAWTNHVHQQTAPAPYASYGVYSTAAAPAGPTTPDGEPLAGWWHRVGATVLDSVFVAILGLIVTLPGQISIQREQTRLQDELTRRLDANEPGALSWFFHQMLDSYRDRIWVVILPVALAWVAQAAFLHYRGGTPGQLVTGLRTRLRERPGHLPWGRAFTRVFLFLGINGVLETIGFVSGSPVLLLVLVVLFSLWGVINPLWAAWDPKRQALHDKIVGTNVVRVRR